MSRRLSSVSHVLRSFPSTRYIIVFVHFVAAKSCSFNIRSKPPFKIMDILSNVRGPVESQDDRPNWHGGEMMLRFIRTWEVARHRATRTSIKITIHA